MGLSHRWPATTLITNGDEKTLWSPVYIQAGPFYIIAMAAANSRCLTKKVFDYNTDFKFFTLRTR